MEIKEFKEKKRKLEGDIAKEIEILMIHFRRETGYSPHAINVDLANATCIGETPDAYIVNSVRAEVDL